MPYIPPNSQMIYQVSVFGHGPIARPFVITFCYVATVPGGPYDSRAAAASLWEDFMYDGFLLVGGANVSWDYIQAQYCTGHNGSSVAIVALGDEQPLDLARKAPEASFLLRRVGAGSPANVRGRVFAPCPLDSDWTDFPQCRHLSISRRALVAGLAAINLGLANMAPYLTEVLYSRRNGGAWPVTAYTMASRPGRVWQRAGFGHR